MVYSFYNRIMERRFGLEPEPHDATHDFIDSFIAGRSNWLET